ncbi:MAG: outer membrane beta-barrel protein [Rectinema subterraneum]|uniref:outer membrane beta-barrel protein n=1 Tax=Rectinema subterraneum TaxID=2653714 RepID=UPI003C7A2744
MRQKAAIRFLFLAVVCLLAVSPVLAQKVQGEAGIGFMAISPNLTDTIANFAVGDMLYGVTVNYAVRPWLSVSTDVLYLGDSYYGPGVGTFSEGPSSWAGLQSASGDKANWKYYESFIYAPLSINLMAPLGIVRPYLGLGPAFYFHFPSTNQDTAFTDYLKTHYGSAAVVGRIGQGLTARVGFDVLLGDSFSVGAGYVVREDTPVTIFKDLGDLNFYKEKGYLFLVGRFYIK